MRKLGICPICGKIGKKYMHWTMSNGKKYTYTVFIHENGTKHRQNINSVVTSESKSSLVREYLLLKLQSPMRFSEISNLLKKETTLSIDNRTITRSLYFLIKRNLVEKKYINNIPYYFKKGINSNYSLQILKSFMTFSKNSLQILLEVFNEGNYMLQEVIFYAPFKITPDTKITGSDVYGEIEPTSINTLYNLNDISLLSIKLNIELKPGDSTTIILKISEFEPKHNFTIRIPYPTEEMYLLMMDPYTKMNANISDTDLFISKKPELIKYLTGLSGKRVKLIKFYKIKKDQIINIYIET